VTITFLPARHWSKRSLFDTLETLWGGYMIQSADFGVYHAGDSGWFGGFAEIAKRFDRIDVAMLPIGAYAPRWFMEPSHISPEEAVRAATVLLARNLIPVHYGSFVLSDEPLTEPPAMLEKAAEGAEFDRARILPIGGTWLLDSEKAV
jgi:L-ascorbate metabolism protein UlaG (beta-lactamase superfamily)